MRLPSQPQSETAVSITGNSEVEEQAPVFSEASPYDIPVAWRTYKSAQLSVGQVNEIMSDAYANKVEAGDSVIPDFGGAKQRFEETHQIENGFWVARVEEQV